MWIGFIQAAMDVLLLPGRVLILLFSIHTMPTEEAVLVLSMSASLVIAAIGYIRNDGSIVHTLFSKWMIPAVLNPALVWLMALVSEQARETFNSTSTYAPGLAFFSPIGVAMFVVMLDLFTGLRKSSTSFPDRFVYYVSETYKSDTVTPGDLYLLHTYVMKGRLYFYVVQWLKESIVYRVPVLGKRISEREYRRAESIFNRRTFSVLTSTIIMLSFSGFLLQRKWYRLLMWIAVRSLPPASQEMYRRMFRIDPAEEQKLATEFVEFVRRHFTEHFGKRVGELMAEYARILVTARTASEAEALASNHPMFRQAYQYIFERYGKAPIQVALLEMPLDESRPIRAVAPSVPATGKPVASTPPATLFASTSVNADTTKQEAEERQKLPSRMPEPTEDVGQRVPISRRARLPES